MSKIKFWIYRHNIYDLQTKIKSCQDQEKLLKEVVFSLAVSMNANTKSSQIKLCLCLKYVLRKNQLVQLKDQKKHPKNEQELKVVFSNTSL